MAKQFSRRRHIAKAITWRLVGTFDTVILAWLLTGEIGTGISIGATELATKMVLYYLHERAWYNLKIFKDSDSRIRHILKTITWRFVGTMDTMFIGWFITGSAEVGLSIGALELFTKMMLYYLHERIWYRSNYGLIVVKNDKGDEKRN